MADMVRCEALLEIPIRCPAPVVVVVSDLHGPDSTGFCLKCLEAFKAANVDALELFRFTEVA